MKPIPPPRPRFALFRAARLLTSIAFGLLLSPCILADDAATAKQLESLGGKLTMKDGAVTQVSFTDCSKIGRDELRAIGQLQHLQSLTLFGKIQALNDSSVGELAGLAELESLSTEGAQLSDAGLAKLSCLTNLRSASFFHLSFRMEGFTGKGFSSWTALKKLERLTVAGMSMGDEGFEAISTLTSLRELSTWHTFQTQTANAFIAQLPNLSSLKLGQRLPRTGVKEPSLSDASLSALLSIKTLATLKIGEARFTLQALRQLKNLPTLKNLTLYETDISEADVETLKAELPAVKIDFQPLTEPQRQKLEVYLK